MDQIRASVFWNCSSHRPPIRLPNFLGSFYIEPKDKSLKTIIFVHGFGGSASGTWSHYHELLLRDDRFTSTRFVFYDYDSLYSALDKSIERFQEFIDALITSVLHGDEARHLMFVAHSLGGLITRKTFIEAKKNNDPWLADSSLILLAPAQAGAFIDELAKELFSLHRGLRVLSILIRRSLVILKDLEADSPGVLELAKDLRRTNDPRVRPTALLIPEYENVVLQRKLAGDPRQIEVKGTNHNTISKASTHECGAYLTVSQFL